MNRKPLERIGLCPGDHFAALRQLGLLYCRPGEFGHQLNALPKRKQWVLAAILILHALPYVFFLIVLVSMSIWIFGNNPDDLFFITTEFFVRFRHISHIIVLGIGVGVSVGIVLVVVGGALGVPSEIVGWITFVIVYGFASGFAEGIAEGVAVGIVLGIATMIFITIFIVFDGGMATNEKDFLIWLATGIATWIVGGIVGGIAQGIASAIAITAILTRSYYLPIHVLFLWPRLRYQSYLKHPVAWDDLCVVPFPGLDRLLADYAEYEPQAGEREIDRLIDNYPTQEGSGLRALARLIARRAGRETDLARLAERVAELPEGEKKFLKWTARIKADLLEIARLQIRLNTQNRPFLREPTARALLMAVREFREKVAGYPDPLASEFRAAASNWLALAEAQHRQASSVLEREPMPQVFRAGDPVRREREAFVRRDAVLGEIDRQLTLATGCPGLILYGRRRMGKSTLLRNLDGFLPADIRVGVVSMQDPEAFSSQSGLLQRLLAEIAGVCPEAGLPKAVETLAEFYRALRDCDAWLGSHNARLLLGVDEYENLDRKLGEGVFGEDLLHLLRESMQYQRRIVWVFAGSHGVAELRHADWTSFLISARTVEISPFSLEETRLLLTEPMRYSPLWQADDSKRPRFAADFWGRDGVERIHAEAGGWPHLLQLLAETAVDLSNERGGGGLDEDLLEQVFAKAIIAGDWVLRQLLRGEANGPEWRYLSGFRLADALPPPDDEAVHAALRQRLLVCEAGNGLWRLRVPMMQRWLRERG